MNEVIAKIFLPSILTVIVISLILKGRKKDLQKQKGLWLILGGFSLILLGSLFEVSEYVSLGIAFWRNFTDKFFYARFCVLVGCLILGLGLIRRLTAVEILQATKGKLLSAQSEVEREILRRQRLEGELEKSQAAWEAFKVEKQKFLVQISHEMRTPLNGVLGMIELLLETKLDIHQQRMAQIIKESGFILLNLINENLDFSTIETGKLRLENKTFNLRHKIEELIELMAERAQAKNLEFNFKLQPDVPVEVQGDPLRLYQILFNLLGNAIKYTKSGEIFLGVRVFEEFEDKVVLHFAVRDTGIGIAPKFHEKVFQPFYQIDSSQSSKREGTGLGLAIVKELVGMMRGKLGLESELGKGSTFWFTLEMKKPLETLQTDEAADGNLEELKIMVGENDPFHLQNLRRHLAALGLQADEAASGKEMLEMLRGAAQRGKPYNLGLISMGLPELNGLQLAKAIKNDWNLRKIKLVLLTSFTDHHVPSEPEAGIEAYLTKPVSAAKLSQCLDALLNWDQGKDQGVREVKNEKPERFKRGPCKVLVAENNRLNQEVVKAMLQSLGCQVDIVETGQQALDAVAKTQYTLIFMDCLMPDMDGFAATQAIRNLENIDNSRERVPIIALTAHALDGDREACLAAGMDDYLSKPVTKSQLQEILARRLKAEPASDPRAEGYCPAEPPLSGREQVHPGSEKPSAGQPLDSRILDEIRSLQQEGTLDLLSRLIQVYVSETPSLLEKLFNAVELQDFGEIYKTAHTLKSSSAHIGALPLAELFRKLEALAKDESLDQAQPVLARISSEYDRVRHALQVELSG